jgi:hypothetical protein
LRVTTAIEYIDAHTYISSDKIVVVEQPVLLEALDKLQKSGAIEHAALKNSVGGGEK